MSKHEEKVDTMKTKPISDDQSGQTDKDGQKLLVSGGDNTCCMSFFLCTSWQHTSVAAACLVETCKPRHNRPALTDFCQTFLSNVQSLESNFMHKLL